MKIDKYFHLYGDKDGVNVHFEEISPPTEKQTDTAEWVAIDDYPNEDWECDNCGYIIAGVEEPYRYCPNCGKKMWK